MLVKFSDLPNELQILGRKLPFIQKSHKYWINWSLNWFILSCSCIMTGLPPVFFVLMLVWNSFTSLGSSISFVFIWALTSHTFCKRCLNSERSTVMQASLDLHRLQLPYPSIKSRTFFQRLYQDLEGPKMFFKLFYCWLEVF